MPAQRSGRSQARGGVALVTGAASGIGAATVERLAGEGMTVCVVDINGDAARRLGDSLGGLGLSCDVSDPRQVDAVFAACTAELGSVDLAMLNAGVTVDWSGDLGELDVDDYRRSVGVNLDGVVFGMRAAVRALRARPQGSQGGVILATASIAGLDPWIPDPVYTAGKHGVIGFVRAAAASLALEGVRVHAICPGFTQTGMLGERGRLVEGLGVPIAHPATIADAVMHAIDAPLEQAGSAWIAEPDRPAWRMEFPEVPGRHNILNVPVRRPSEPF